MVNEQRFSLSPSRHGQFIFPAIIVVEMFLEMHFYWFVDPKNSFYGQRERCRAFLLRHLEEKFTDDESDLDLSYILNRFKNEWLNEVFISQS